MIGRRTHALLALGLASVMVQAAMATPADVGTNERRITALQAARLAVNHLAEDGPSYRLHHPRRQVDLTPDGIRVQGVDGAPAWSWTLEAIVGSDGRDLVEVGPVAPVAMAPILIRVDRCLLFEDYLLDENSMEQRMVIPEPLPMNGHDLVVTGGAEHGRG